MSIASTFINISCGHLNKLRANKTQPGVQRQRPWSYQTPTPTMISPSMGVLRSEVSTRALSEAQVATPT